MLNLIPYELMKLLGWATVILVMLAALFYFLLLLNKSLAGNNHSNAQGFKKTLRRLIPIIRSYHKSLGIMAFFTGISHGYLLLRSIELHTGYITWTLIALLGFSGILQKIKATQNFRGTIRKLHTDLMYGAIIMMISHVVLMKSL